MTETEARSMFEAIAITFPHIGDYIDRLPSPQETLAQWTKMLSPIGFDDATAAVERWKSGEIEPPSYPSEMGTLPLRIRGMAGRIADERAKAARTERLAEESRKRNAFAGPDNLGRCVRWSMYAGELLKLGKITPERNREIVSYLELKAKSPTSDVVIPPEIKAFIAQSRSRQSVAPLSIGELTEAPS